MEDAAIRNFRDFLLIYNQMTDLCFNRCVDTLSYRTLSNDEEQCVDKCARKHININHRMMSIYMEVQPLIVSRRIEEINKANEAAAAAEAATAAMAAVPDTVATSVSTAVGSESSSSSISANTSTTDLATLMKKSSEAHASIAESVAAVNIKEMQRHLAVDSAVSAASSATTASAKVSE